MSWSPDIRSSLVEQRYTTVWGRVRAVLETCERDGLDLRAAMTRVHQTRLTALLTEDQHSDPQLEEWFSPCPTDAFGLRLFTMVTVHGHFVLAPRRELPLVAPIMAGYVTAATSSVVELGSGPGWNLADLILSDPSASSRRYWACEYTQEGRSCSELIARLAPEVRLTTVPFDYRTPQYDFIEKDEHVLVFSSHSMEQVPRIDPEVILGIFRRSRNAVVVLWEPIGWQWSRSAVNHWDKIAARSKEPPARLAFVINAPADQRIFAEYSARSYYNLNLRALLLRLEKEGEIVPHLVVLDEHGLNAFNPSTRVVLTHPDRQAPPGVPPLGEPRTLYRGSPLAKDAQCGFWIVP